MKSTLLALAVGLAGFGMSCGYAQAQTLIDQNKALAGGITPGDTPGFPITLSQPGSYKLTSNLTVPANTNGIEVSADGVTIDLNGFTLGGPVNCTGSGAQLVCDQGKGYGITYAPNKYVPSRHLTVRNGTVTGFAYNGVDVGNNAYVDSMRIVGNGGAGLNVAGSNAVVAGGIFSTNGTVGIGLGGGAGNLAHHVTVSGNRAGGIGSSFGAMVQSAVIMNNGGTGINGGSIDSSNVSGNGYNIAPGVSTGTNRCGAAAC